LILISRKVDYGILSLSYLAGAQKEASAREISERFGISRAFVANILKQLCQVGLLEGQRGMHGGYKLALPADMITLERIIESLEGPFRLMSCVEGDEHEDCGLMNSCPVRSPLKTVHDRIVEALRRTTLAELVQNESHVFVSIGSER
jgi:Rrf2 family protein